MYYMMLCLSPSNANHAMLGYIKDDRARSWHSGTRFTVPPPEPIQVEVDPDMPGIIPEFTDQPLPLMSQRLLAALQSAGVTNLDNYRAVITDPTTNRVYDDHVAVNIIGKVAAADKGKSGYDPEIPWFDKVVLDKLAPRGALMFRLAESVNAILVHESVKKRVESSGIDTLTWVPPEQWAG
jgi:hypothetical protein